MVPRIICNFNISSVGRPLINDLIRDNPTFADTSSNISGVNTPDTFSITSPIFNPALSALLSFVICMHIECMIVF